MSRRFPPPLFGIERTERRSRAFVELALHSEGELDKSTFISRVRDWLRKPETGDRYSKSYLRRVVSTYIQLGVLRRCSDDTVTVWQFGKDWNNDEIDFETFLWYAIKRAWVLDGGFPEGIDGLRAIHRTLMDAEAPLGRTEIRDRLADDYDYEFNEEGIRGFPTLLSELGAVEETENGYIVAEPTERWQSRFRNVDLLPAFERWLKREGAGVEPPSATVKRDLSKYYIYRESGGHGKHRQLFDTFRRDYLKDTAYENDVSQPTIRRAEKYVDAEKQRKNLREEIKSQYPSFSSNDLSGLSTTVLENIATADNLREAFRIKSSAGTGLSRSDIEQWAGADRPLYTFPSEFELYDWQHEAADRWFDVDGPDDPRDTPRAGIARVVTGAGKTVMALEVIRRWLDRNPDGVVSVVVPTNVLMRQWLEELVETLNVPTEDIGWAGGGTKDEFEDGYRIIVTIVNSAVRDDFLGNSLDAANVSDHFLVADECHRYTGEKFSDIFDYPRTASLGLSATPLSNPGEEDKSEDDELLLRELGEIYYELTYGEAIANTLIPEFHVNYVGFDLTDAERETYERLSEKVADAVADIETRYGGRLYELNGGYAQNLKTIANSIDGPTPAIGDFFRYTQERRDLVADAIGRQAITLLLLKDSITEENKTIVFQERIEQLERMVAASESRGRNYRTGELSEDQPGRQELYDRYPGLKMADKGLEELFFDADYRPVMYHSGHRSAAWNDFAVDWFDDDGFANVMLSVKALIEGVDVPSADVGIVRVSSGSVRQRIQTLGRVLRTGSDPDDASELYVLYARDTVDEKIFQDYDWEKQFSNAEVSHLSWDPQGDWEVGDWDPSMPFWDCVRPATEDEKPEPKRPRPDLSDLSRGDLYPGPREGYHFSVDSEGRPFEKSGDGRRRITHDGAEELAEFIYELKGGGKVVINDHDHALTTTEDGYIFVGEIDPDEFEYQDQSQSMTDEPDQDELDGIF